MGKLKSTSLKVIGLALVAGVLIPSAVLASNIASAGYFGRVIVTNNGSTAVSNTSTVFTLNTTSMIAAGMISANGSDVAIRNPDGTDTEFMPGYAGSPWAVFVSQAAGVSTQNLYLYSKNVTGGALRYFPGAEGMNVTDNASLELGSNFTINQTAFIDTTAGANKTLVYKPGAITISSVGSTLNVTVTWSSPLSFNLTPTGNGTETTIANLIGAATHWQAVLTNDGGTSYVTATFGVGGGRDLFTSNYSTSRNATINAIAVFAYSAETSNSSTTNYRLSVGVNGTTYDSSAKAISRLDISGWQLISSNWTSNPKYTRDWLWADLPLLEFGMAGGDSIYPVGTTQVWAVVYYTPVNTLTIPISAGEQTISTSTTTGNLSIAVNGVTRNTTPTYGATIVNTANDYQFCTADATPYVQEVSIYTNGTQQARWQWAYGTTFPDLTGNGHTATPTFRTATSNANVTANLSSFSSYQTLPTPPSFSSNSSFTMFTSVPSAPDNMYSELNMTFFGAGVLTQFASDTQQPIVLMVFIYTFGIAILVGGLAYAITIGAGVRRRFGSESSGGHQGSLFIMSAAIFATLMYFTIAGGGVIPAFVLIPFGIKAVGLMLMEKSPSPVG